MNSHDRCYVCGSMELEARRVEYIYRRRGKYLIVRDVPCEVCLRCGEHYYLGGTLLHIEQRFQAIHEQQLPPKSAIQVPIEAYTT